VGTLDLKRYREVPVLMERSPEVHDAISKEMVVEEQEGGR
jgi:hypothetical protein